MDDTDQEDQRGSEPKKIRVNPLDTRYQRSKVCPAKIYPTLVRTIKASASW